MMAGEQRRRAAEEALGIERRVMPVNLDLEQAVLGVLLMNNNAFRRCSDILTVECFTEELHRRIYNVIEELIQQQKNAGPITVRQFVGDHDLGGMTVAAYLARLAASAGLPSEVRGYAMMLNDLRIRRQMISIAQDALDQAYDAPVSLTGKTLVDSVLDRVSLLQPALSEKQGFEGFKTVGRRVVLAAEETYRNGALQVGLSTGLPRLDEALGGLRPTDFIVLAGRPGMGKSALAGQIVYNVAGDLDARQKMGEKTGVVGVFSFEMSSEQFCERIVCMQANVPPWKIRRKKLTGDDVQAMDDAWRHLDALPIEINDGSGVGIHKLAMEAKALHKKHGLALLIIDYLQLMPGSGKSDNRAQQLTEITVGLKALAKELNVPVIALSQLNRTLENRDDRRPMLSDLKESGSIEQDADAVMFIYRDEYYLGKAPPEGTEFRMKWDRKHAAVKGIAEVIIGKNRHGPTGAVELGFDGAFTRFMNEPESRDEWADEPRAPREKKKTLSVQAMQALKILRQLTLSDAVIGQELEKVPSFMTRPVSYLLWREKCALQIMDPSHSDPVIANTMKSICLELHDLDVAVRAGTKDNLYMWVTPKGQTYQ